MERDKVRNLIKEVIACSVAWGMGYVGLWAGKWVLATVALGDNILEDAKNAFIIRSSSSEYENTFNYMQVIMKNVDMLIKKTYFIIFIAILCYFIWLAYKHRQSIHILSFIPFGLVCLFPFGWYFVTKNHSFGHYWMTYRILGIVVFSFICGYLACLNRKR